MGQKAKVIWGFILLAVGAGGYYYVTSEMNNNAYRMAKYFGRGNHSLEVIGWICLVVGLIGIIFLIRALFHWFMWGGNRNEDEA